MRITVRVSPGAKRTAVGGRYGDTEPPVLIVRVTAPPVDGKANAAVVTALAQALRIPRGDVRIVGGLTGRTKAVELTGVPEAAVRALVEIVEDAHG